MSLHSAHENEAGHLALRLASREKGVAPRIGRFLFVRHGRTPGNIARVYQHPDIPLAPEGFADADVAAAALVEAEFAHIFASDMARAWLTAGRIAAATGKAVAVRQALRERYFGDLIGTPSVGLDWRVDPPNGETMLGFVARTLDGMAEMLVPGPTPLLVSHGGVLRVLCGALDVELPTELTANGLPLAFERAGAGWRVVPLVEPAPVQQLGAA